MNDLQEIIVSVLAGATTFCALHTLSPETNDERNAVTQRNTAIAAAVCVTIAILIGTA